MSKKRRKNNQIKADKVRLIDDNGEQVGVFALKKALEMAKEKSLDLIEVAPDANPPVCKIGDYSKFIYREQKKQKKQKTKAGELKNVQLSFNISDHDLETRKKEAEKFLNKGHKVRVKLFLKGRENALEDHAREKVEAFLESLKKTTPFKIEKGLKKRPQGLTTIISKK